MTKEDKELLLKDLCARLPYKVKCQIAFDEEDIHIETLESVSPTMLFNQVTTSGSVVSIENVKPYLRPMSSMTEEELETHRILYGNLEFEEYVDFLNAHHFDFRNLIERGLAIDCTGLNVY